MAKYLRNTNNGRVLPWSPAWAARKDMIPCDLQGNTDSPVGGEPPTEPTSVQTSGGDADSSVDDAPPAFDPNKVITEKGEVVHVDQADTATLSAYAERHFGEKIDKRTKAGNAAARVRELIAENGHPDE